MAVPNHSPAFQNPAINIRPAERSDRDFILGLVPRFVEFGLPAWREIEQMTAKNLQVIEDALNSPAPDSQFLIGADSTGALVGYIHLQTVTDHFSSERYGYVSAIAVEAAGEGCGVGQALMQAGEAWATDQGYRVLTLDVFSSNQRACGFYEKLGYREEIRKYVKVLKS